VGHEEMADAATSLEAVLPQDASKKLRKVIRKKAMDLLMRREHAVAELERKLIAKDYDADTVVEVVKQLTDEGLVNDARFTEAFVRYRRNNGYGPRRIQSELRERGVSEKIQAAYLDVGDSQWFEQAAQVQNKRFGGDMKALTEKCSMKHLFGRGVGGAVQYNNILVGAAKLFPVGHPPGIDLDDVLCGDIPDLGIRMRGKDQHIPGKGIAVHRIRLFILIEVP